MCEVPRPLCLLDANILIADRRFRGAPALAFLRALARGELDAAVPWVALEEAVNEFRETAVAAARTLKKTQRQLGGLGIDWSHMIHPTAETDAYRLWLLDVLRTHDIAVLPVPDASHEDFVRWDIAGRKPFKPGGKGYRDALIWHSVLTTSRERPVFFVTANASDFAAGKNAKDELAPALGEDVATVGGGEGSVRLMPSLSDVLEAIGGEAADIVEALNRAFETSRPVRSALIAPLKEAIVESQTYDLEVEDVPGLVVEILQEMVHEPITLQVERATEIDSDVYLLQLYVEADVDVHVAWTRFESEFTSYDNGHYESQGTTATLWYSVNATYNRTDDSFHDVAVYGASQGTITVGW